LFYEIERSRRQLVDAVTGAVESGKDPSPMLYGLAELPFPRMVLGRVADIVSRHLISPEVYRSVGLDPAEARRAALANPAHHETIRYGSEKIVAFLREAGMIGPPAAHLWRRAHMID
jgi:hypothetical protein